MRWHRRAHFWSMLTMLLVAVARHVALAQAVTGDSQGSAIGPTIFGVPVAAGLSWLAWRKRLGLLQTGKSLLARLGPLISALSARFLGGAKEAAPSASTPDFAIQPGDEEIGPTVVIRRPTLGMIICVSGVLLGKRWDVPMKGLSIGRDPGSDIVVNDKRVSARHARIRPRDGRVVVMDDGSSNGVFLNESSKRLDGEVTLDRGDLVRLSDTDAAEFIYRT